MSYSSAWSLPLMPCGITVIRIADRFLYGWQKVFEKLDQVMKPVRGFQCQTESPRSSCWQVARRLQLVRYLPGDVIIRQGEAPKQRKEGALCKQDRKRGFKVLVCEAISSWIRTPPSTLRQEEASEFFIVDHGRCSAHAPWQCPGAGLKCESSRLQFLDEDLGAGFR